MAQKIWLVLLVICSYLTPCLSQINTQAIDIVRDKWGIPHIYGPDDEHVAYGFAWATAEDKFEDVQELFLPTKNLMGSVNGKDGVVRDIFMQFIDAEEMVKERYQKDLSPEFIKVLDAYVAGINDYAMAHPEKILHKKLFPITPIEVLKAYVLNVTAMSFAAMDISNVYQNKLTLDMENFPKGSNGFAIKSTKTTSGETFLCSNSHQPWSGAFAWYEAHLCTENGVNMIGSTFPGGPTLFQGTSEHISWTHMLNFPDVSDVYKLKMHPKKKHQYLLDGKWYDLEKKKAKLKIKVGPFNIPVSKKFYESIHGLVLKNKSGYYAIRFPSNMDIKAPEQWFRMQKSTNFDEFKRALEIQGLPSMNVIYADKEDNIFYLGNGKISKDRREEINYKKLIPGFESKYIWQANYYPIDSLPHVLNPGCGYLFNGNSTPFNVTCPENNPVKKYNFMGYSEHNTNRSARFHELIGKYNKLSYEDFKQIKFDKSYTQPAVSATFGNINMIYTLDPIKYPDLKDAIELIKNWDGSMDLESKAGAMVSFATKHYLKIISKKGSKLSYNELTEEQIVEGLRVAKKHMLKHFNKIDAPLKEVQYISKGDKELPIWGGMDIISAVGTKTMKDGRLKGRSGDSYISFVRFSKDQPVKIETINVYGASNDPASPHFNDQMEMFVKQELRTMTLNKEVIYKQAERIYHPGE